ncbi:hypothetical protein [Aliiruegeria lutimaris]|uniref:Uncharacterized protein n=1 Tax=Aliiruegeria lutimaris TaxID=571298 RepID=A0A1G9J3A0_9RHOB|nr:hypothetical protein [Aliiruegeria lutimaris]SDL31703.1 hypothetical protein SAMN04488026_10786 [Aliiruegeria lutimaris]
MTGTKSPRGQSLKQRIVDLVLEKDFVTFVEIAELPGAKGNLTCAIGSKMGAKVWFVLWYGLSEEACRAIHELIKGGPVGFILCHPIIYQIDGCVPKIPPFDLETLERRIAAKPKQTRDFWMPLQLRPIERTTYDLRMFP